MNHICICIFNAKCRIQSAFLENITAKNMTALCACLSDRKSDIYI